MAKTKKVTEAVKPVEVVEVKGKVIKGYTRYEILPNGVVQNATTGAPLKIEEKGSRPFVRLTNDKGVRVWLSTEELFTQYYQIDIENKVKPSAKPEKLASFSKSQRIWILLQSGMTIKEVASSDPEFNEGHVRNVAKNYKLNPQKVEQVTRLQKLIEKQAQEAK